MRVAGLTALLAGLAVLLAGCAAEPGPDATAPGAASGTSVLDDRARLAGAGVTLLRPQVLGAVRHDPSAFTQGLEYSDGVLLEGTGRRGRSEIRELDPVTGAVRRRVPLPPEVFGEGLTAAGGTVWQLTWTDRVVYVRDRATLAVRRTLPLDREGWGVCASAGGLVTSDGSSTLVVRDPATLGPRRAIPVRAAGVPVDELNELECTGGGVWANVWRTDHLVRIDPATGRVTAVVDAAGLLDPVAAADADVLNGIAAVPGGDEFWITGKLWPTTFRVRFATG